MKKTIFLLKILTIYLLLISKGFASESKYFKEGEELFNKKEFKESKVLFQRDIVFNPKSEKSYLYLAKIFEENENDLEQEMNLDNVIRLNPQNDEAIYMLIILKIKQFDYDSAKELIEKFDLVCKSFCDKKGEIKKKLSMLTPKNEKNKN